MKRKHNFKYLDTCIILAIPNDTQNIVLRYFKEFHKDQMVHVCILDYYVTFLYRILYFARGRFTSARKPSGSNIQRSRDNLGCEIKNTILWFLYQLLKVTW